MPETVPTIDPAAIRSYCEIVFADPPVGGFIALRGLAEAGQSASPYLVWLDPQAPRWIDGVIDFVQVCDRRGLAAYCIPGFVKERGGASSMHMQSLPSIIVDFDAGDISAKCDRAIKLLGTPSLAVKSGGIIDGQFKQHLYWRLANMVGPETTAALRASVARVAGADGAFGRTTQPIRIAGSIHRKAAPVLVEVLYTSPAILDEAEVARRLEKIATPVSPSNSSGLDFAAPDRNTLGLARTVPMDALPMTFVGHGETTINRFEAMTRMMGMMLSNIHDADDTETCAREFGFFREWARGHIENVERDYDLALHWRRLLARERWKRSQPRRPRARPVYARRG